MSEHTEENNEKNNEKNTDSNEDLDLTTIDETSPIHAKTQETSQEEKSKNPSDYDASGIDVLEGLESCSNSTCHVHRFYWSTRITSFGI